MTQRRPYATPDPPAPAAEASPPPVPKSPYLLPEQAAGFLHVEVWAKAQRHGGPESAA